MKNTYFNPEIDKIDRVVPTEYDSIYRKKMIKGQVHDENTYLMGGVSGHAGLFSNAWDIAIFMKLFLNEGVWLGKRHFNKSTIKKFTKNMTMSICNYAFKIKQINQLNANSGPLKAQLGPQEPPQTCPGYPQVL